MAITFDDYAEKYGQGHVRERGEVTLLPDPVRRDRKFTIFSVDDHVVEPPDTFDGRLPTQYQDRGPRVVDMDDGGQAWLYDGQLLPNIGFNAVVGRPRDEVSYDPARFDEMRRGAWDVHARVADMDLDGVYASLCFPSFLAGFGGGRLQTVTKDAKLAFAVLQAYNDWHLESWVGAAPDRFVACQLPWLHDVEIGALEIRKNAERGFRAVTFPESPDKHGFPSIFSHHWDPIMAACEETETVVCLHTGSAGTLPATTPDSPADIPAILFGVYAMLTCVDWLYSLIPVRFPRLKLCMSEGGIGWVAGLFDRLDHSLRYIDQFQTWAEVNELPQEVLARNFWFCALDDPTSYVIRDRIGIDRIMVEVDYPHTDSIWPDSQASLAVGLEGLPADDVRKMTWENAANLFRFPVPQAVQSDPYAF